MDAQGFIDLIAALLQGGTPLLALYLYFQERESHRITRQEFRAEIKELHAARIEDHKLWLDILTDYLGYSRGKPVFPPASTEKPVPSVKSQQIDSK